MSKALIRRKSSPEIPYTNLLLLIIGIAIGYFIWRSKSATPTQFNNLETWNWTDWQGRNRSISVHREVKGG